MTYQYFGSSVIIGATATAGLPGIHRSAFPHAKRGGMMPMRVRAVPLSMNVLLRMLGSALKRLTHSLWRMTKTGGAPGS